MDSRSDSHQGTGDEWSDDSVRLKKETKCTGREILRDFMTNRCQPFDFYHKPKISPTLTCENVEKPAISGVILSCLDLHFSPARETCSNDCILPLQLSLSLKYTFFMTVNNS